MIYSSLTDIICRENKSASNCCSVVCGFTLYSRRESNPYQRNRNPSFYPLNYRSMDFMSTASAYHRGNGEKLKRRRFAVTKVDIFRDLCKFFNFSASELLKLNNDVIFLRPARRGKLRIQRAVTGSRWDQKEWNRVSGQQHRRRNH